MLRSPLEGMPLKVKEDTRGNTSELTAREHKRGKRPERVNRLGILGSVKDL